MSGVNDLLHLPPAEPPPLDPRKVPEVLAAMGRLARAMAAAEDDAQRQAALAGVLRENGSRQWLARLFADSAAPGTAAPGTAATGALRHPAEASSALLAALAGVLVQVLTRYNGLPAAWYDDFLRRHLGQQPAAAQPDRVLVAFPAPAKGGVLGVATGTTIIAEDVAKIRRRYRTDQHLVVLPSTIGALFGYQRLPDGRDLLVRHALTEGVLAGPIRPFGDPAAVDSTWVQQLWYVGGAPLAAASAGTVLTLRLEAVAPDPAAMAELLAGCRWSVSGAKGLIDLPLPAVRRDGAAVEAVVPLPVAPVAPLPAVPGLPPGEPYLCVAPGTPAVAAGLRLLSCGDIRLALAGDGIPAVHLSANGAPLDATQPFQPFGAVPAPGSNFAITEDRLFALPLADLAVTVIPADSTQQAWRADPIAAGGGLVWEARRDGAWRGLLTEGAATVPEFGGAQTLTPGSATALATAESSGGDDDARVIRCRLADADFGWRRYQRGMADFTAWAAGRLSGDKNLLALLGAWGKRLTTLVGLTGDPRPAPPVVPVAPMCQGVHLRFRSRPLGLGPAVFSRSAPSAIQPGELPRMADGRLRPFGHGTDGAQGVLFWCLAGPAPVGELAVYLRIAATPGEKREQSVLTLLLMGPGGEWKPRDLVDGTGGFSRSGFLRFHAPAAWPVFPSPYLGDSAVGRWLMLVIDRSETAGTIEQVSFNVVGATYVLAGATDPLPAIPLTAGARLSLERTIAGLAPPRLLDVLVPGRGPEATAAFHHRAAGIIRHRQRAVSPWDIERLIADRFARIALVRCVCSDPQPSAAPGGIIRVVVVPDDTDPYPMVDGPLHDEIAAWLAELAPANARIELRDPTFTPVRISARLRINDGYTLDGARQAVSTALGRLLHPVSSAGGIQGFGQPLLLNRVEHLLFRLPEVRQVEQVAFAGGPAERIAITAAGPADLLTSDGGHRLEMLP